MKNTQFKKILSLALLGTALGYGVNIEYAPNHTQGTYVYDKTKPKETLRVVSNGVTLDSVSRDDKDMRYGIYCIDDKLIVPRKLIVSTSPPCLGWHNMGQSKVVGNTIEMTIDPLPLNGIAVDNIDDVEVNMNVGLKTCERMYGTIYTRLELQRLVKGKWERYCSGSFNTINTMNTMKKGK